MRLLALTSIFPNAVMPHYAPYIRQQCEALSVLCDLEIMATIPWLPFARLLRRWTYWGADFSRVPSAAQVGSLRVEHPRFVRIPGLSLTSGLTYAASIAPHLVGRKPRPDALLATWAYPDGMAAVLLGKALGIPTFIQTIGSDVNVVAKLRGPRKQLNWAFREAAGIFAVSEPLAQAVVALGAPRERVFVVPTGVDKRVFRPRSKRAAREALGTPLDAKLILFVGRLYREKGLGELCDAFIALRRENQDVRLVVVGEGPFKEVCQAKLAEHSHLVTFTGEVPFDVVTQWLAACDLLTLPSYQEGTPNVVMEAMACGRPVVATNVGGIPSLITSDVVGRMVPPRDVVSLTAALRDSLSREVAPEAVVAASALIDWDENARRVLSAIQNGYQ